MASLCPTLELVGPSPDEQPVAPTCTVCLKAERMGGAIRCMACGRWVPRVDRLKATGGPSGSAFRGDSAEVEPTCPQCRPDEQRPRATIRLPYRVFYKCDRCLSVWSVDAKRL